LRVRKDHRGSAPLQAGEYALLILDPVPGTASR